MDKSRYIIAPAAIAALTLLSPLASSPARADVLAPILGSYSAHFNNMEDFFDPTTGKVVTSGFGGVGQQNFGIDVLGSISSSSGGAYGGPGFGGYLVGVFGGITVGTVVNDTTGTSVPGFGPGDTGFATGGAFHLYEIPTTDFSSVLAFNAFIKATSAAGFIGGGCGGQTLAQVAGGTGFCYNGLTTLPGVSNVLNFALQPAYDSFITTGGTVVPLGGDYTLGASFSSTLAGEATAWGDITGGVDAAQFTYPTQLTPLGTLTDISLIDDFCPEGPGCTSRYGGMTDPGWSVASSDPIDGYTAPEPGTLAIFTSQLVCLGAFVGWRRKRRGG